MSSSDPGRDRLLLGMHRILFRLGLAAALVLVCSTASGRDDSHGKSLLNWGYCLADSIQDDSMLQVLERSAGWLSVLCVIGFKIGKDGALRRPSLQVE